VHYNEQSQHFTSGCAWWSQNKHAAIHMAALNVTRTSSDFSTNRHDARPHELLERHPDICFEDGNLAVLAGSYYCLVHQGVLSRISDTLKMLVTTCLKGDNVRFQEGRPVLHLQDSPDDLGRFLLALYDGMYGIILLVMSNLMV
jgi:hypothetical protein